MIAVFEKILVGASSMFPSQRKDVPIRRNASSKVEEDVIGGTVEYAKSIEQEGKRPWFGIRELKVAGEKYLIKPFGKPGGQVHVFVINRFPHLVFKVPYENPIFDLTDCNFRREAATIEVVANNLIGQKKLKALDGFPLCKIPGFAAFGYLKVQGLDRGLVVQQIGEQNSVTPEEREKLWEFLNGKGVHTDCVKYNNSAAILGSWGRREVVNIDNADVQISEENGQRFNLDELYSKWVK
ncbi:MAG: hypothetical protein HYY52_00480 [Candidatus Melainabacteria bacterium]|nr:hypothetical protein [Candidatus Melainabacteria bacterium]